MDETTRRENLAGEEAQAALCGTSLGRLETQLHQQKSCFHSSGLCIGAFNSIYLRIQNWSTSYTIAFEGQNNN